MAEERDVEKANNPAETASDRSLHSTSSSVDLRVQREKEESAGVGPSPSAHQDSTSGGYDANVELVPGHDLDTELARTHGIDNIRRVETRTSMRSKVSRVSGFLSRNRSRTGAQIARDPIPESDLSQGIVAWDSQDDPEMPMNWSATRKWIQVGLIATITLLTPFASSALSPGITSLMVEFGVESQVIGSMTVSIYLLGYVIGPLLLAPLSEMYGKKVVLDASNIFFSLSQIGCALSPNIGALIIFRLFSGIGGSACLTLGGGVIGDMFPIEQRGLATGFWVLGPLLGPTFGPLIGAFLSQSIGWRWIFWIVLILGSVVSITIIIWVSETNYTIIIERKVTRLSKELGRSDLRNHYQRQKEKTSALVSRSLLRPMKLLFFSPMVFFLSTYIAFIYGVLYLLFTTIPTVFEENYGFPVSLTGLVNLAIGVGNLVGWAIVTFQSDKHVIKLAEANGGEFEPEMRLSMVIYFSAFLPVTFFWYGWVAEYKVHWFCPIAALIPYGLGMIGVFLPITTYLVDCYPTYAASAIAANTVLRSLVGAFLPLAGPPMYEALGLGWGNSTLGFICFAMIPIPVLFHRFGKRLRKAEKFQL